VEVGVLRYWFPHVDATKPAPNPDTDHSLDEGDDESAVLKVEVPSNDHSMPRRLHGSTNSKKRKARKRPQARSERNEYTNMNCKNIITHLSRASTSRNEGARANHGKEHHMQWKEKTNVFNKSISINEICNKCVKTRTMLRRRGKRESFGWKGAI
jgi:hypothetical protein